MSDKGFKILCFIYILCLQWPFGNDLLTFRQLVLCALQNYKLNSSKSVTENIDENGKIRN